MTHICVGGCCRWTPRRKEESLGNYKLGHWVEQLQIIRKSHKMLVRIAVADAWSRAMYKWPSVNSRTLQFLLKLLSDLQIPHCS